MCNEIRRRIALGEIRDDFAELRIPLNFPEGAPNLAPMESVRITDPSPIVRRAADGGAELVQRRWSWPIGNGRPLYNFRSEGRRFAAASRCLIPADGFFEFTDPVAQPGEPKPKRKTKWLFTLTGEPWFCIAGIWRDDPQVGEAFTMLTCDPGPDIAPYHGRQVVVLGRKDWARWLDPEIPAADLLVPSPEGTLTVAPA